MDINAKVLAVLGGDGKVQLWDVVGSKGCSRLLKLHGAGKFF